MLLVMDYRSMDNLGNYLSTHSYIKKFNVRPTGIIKDNNNNNNKIYLPSD